MHKGKLHSGVCNGMVKVDIKRFLHDRIWFGWYYIGSYTGWRTDGWNWKIINCVKAVEEEMKKNG